MTPDLFERAERLTRRLERIRKQEDTIKAQLDMALLLADVAALLRTLDTRHMSDGKRLQLAGVKRRVFAALGHGETAA